ncbi:1-alkyl-2-acetylglycerophosphocholine esterase [Fusarium flagelliforme]|uniref:1-alkyl-2-acetylglycerophosphocholine esterase n=1 Tax=Fusarium flagelliforme TaxID=2675880 RepID=A0A395MJH4_9HYPO|nr:1-alkyl-2-acetylglycerophosphocholine esterase [Fusarium flagelliforme]
MSEEIPIPVLQDTESGEAKTAGPLRHAEYVASNLGIERAEENISADRIRRDELIFHRIVVEMAMESQIARGVALHKLRTYLLKDNSNVDAKSEHNETALQLAVINGIDEAIPELIKYGADVHVETEGKTQSLHLAASEGYRAIVELLLDNGADHGAQDDKGRTALYVASWLGYTDIVELLLSKGAKATVGDEDGWSPLHLAISGGYKTIFQHLLDSDKSNINQSDSKYGYVPLIAAATWGQTEMASELIKAGADLNFTDVDGWSPLHHAIWKGHGQVLSLLLKETVDPNIQNRDGCTALHFAMTYHNEAIIPELLAYGAKVDIRDNDDWTSLHFAARYSDAATASGLLNVKGEAIHHQDKGGLTPLHIASKRGNMGVLQLLLDRGAIVNVRGTDSSTALHLASDARVWYGHYESEEGDYEPDDSGNEDSSNLKHIQRGEVISLLMDHGADPHIKNDKEKTPMDLIMGHKDPTRFCGLLSHICRGKALKQNAQEHQAVRQLKLEDMLERQEFASLLSKLIRQSPRSDQAEDTLRLARYMVLDIIQSWSQPRLSHHLPSVIWLLLAASDRDRLLSDRCQAVLASLKKMNSQQTNRHPMKKPQKNLKADTSTPARHGKDQPIMNIAGLDLSSEQKNNPMEAYEESVPDSLRLVCDILRDPPYSQLHADDYSQYKEPKAGEGLDDILDNYDAIVVQLYKNRGQSGVIRRYRSVKEIIYGEGPTDVMRGAMRDLEAMRSKGLLPKDHVMNDGEEPRFRWIHLPATNIVWMKDLLKRITIEHGCGPEEYYELKSFFQDSWIQVPDGETPSRMMKPRAVIRDVNDARQINDSESEDTGERQAGNPFKDGTDTSSHDLEGREDTTEEEQKESRPGSVRSTNDNTAKVESTHSEQKQDPGSDGAQSEKGTNKPDGSEELPKVEEFQPEKSSSKIMPASALYMPYLCFSTHYRESTKPQAKPPGFENYHSLLRAYSSSVIHESPTLDEWYYNFYNEQYGPDLDSKANADRINRNEDQVVTKFLKELERADDEDHFTLLRVNQIWIWVVGNKWILSASSCSLDDNHDNLVEGVLDQLNKQAEYGGNRSQPESADAMAKIIVDYCGRDETEIFNTLSRSAPDTSRGRQDTQGQEPHSLSRRRQSSLAFWKSTNKPWSEEAMRKSIEKAKKLFCDIKDVRDELNILKSAARFQRVVQRNLARGKRNLDISADYVENDIREMDEVASRIQSALNTTLSLQQSEIANEQAQISANQNKVLMTFTFATLLFLPLSFLSSLFALDADSFQKTPSWVFAVIFLVALAVSIIIYLGAWFVTNPSVRHSFSEFARRGLSGHSDSLKEPSGKDADERPKDERDHGSDNKKLDRGQRLSLSTDTPTVMRLRKSHEQKLNMSGGTSHDASWYA